MVEVLSKETTKMVEYVDMRGNTSVHGTFRSPRFDTFRLEERLRCSLGSSRDFFVDINVYHHCFSLEVWMVYFRYLMISIFF